MTDVGIAIRARAFPAARSRRPRARRVLTASALWAAVVANSAVITGLWVAGGGLASDDSAGQLFTSLGRITGLLGAYLALIQVLLLARIPWLERLVGFDRLTVWHKRNGRATLLFVLAHVVFITIGYAALDRISIPHEISQLLGSYPGMITATVGTALMLAVVATSVVIVRRRLRYEAWYAVHVAAYAAIALAWFHQIPNGNELATKAIASDYWRSLYIATLALLVVFRIAQPIVRSLRHRLRVADVTVEGPGVVSLRITGHRLERLDAKPGQFFLWRFLSGRGRWWEAHPFSLSEAPDGRSFRITVKALGDFTSRIGELTPGTRVVAEGPFGTFTGEAARRDKVALIAGGIGITPLRALAEQTNGDTALVYRALSEDDLVLREELEQLARERGIELHYVVGDHATPGGRTLLSRTHLRRLIPDIAEREVYLCGPPAMADALKKNLRRAGVPRKHLHIERFAL